MTSPSGSKDSLAPLIPEAVPKLLRDLIHERTGLFFEPEHFDTLLEKLQPRVVAHGCRSYLDYYYILKYDEKGPDEWRRVMDAFSVQETYFWREVDQVRALVDVVVPQWFARGATPLRIWSAACATGEEPYTIAIALEQAGWGSHPIEIVASDASEAALEKARAGLYRERSFRALPLELREKYFTSAPGGAQLDRRIMERVAFHRANLVVPVETNPLARAQVVFCRNVFIYFSAASISRVVAAFAAQMPAGAHLFVGASESLLRLTTEFELEEIRGAFVYVRKPRSAP